MCPLRVSISWPVSPSHTFTVSSPLADASRLPSGLNATPDAERHAPDHVGMPLEGADFLPVAASHSFTVSSQLAEARRLPSGLNATPVTTSVCP